MGNGFEEHKEQELKVRTSSEDELSIAQRFTAANLPSKVKSDGGSTDYYKIPVPRHVMKKLLSAHKSGETPILELGEIIEMVFNDSFKYGNILKALRRIFECENGRGKQGTSIEYDLNKIDWFLEQIRIRNDLNR